MTHTREDFIDTRGQKVTIGDMIAVSFAHLNDVKIRVGKITDILVPPPMSYEATLLVVSWEPHYAGKKIPKTSRIHANSGRFIKVELPSKEKEQQV